MSIQITRLLIESVAQFQTGSMSVGNIEKAIEDSFDTIQRAYNGDLEAMVDLSKNNVHKYFDKWEFDIKKLEDFCIKNGLQFRECHLSRDYIFRTDPNSDILYGLETLERLVRSAFLNETF
jgi:hypothetical protein